MILSLVIALALPSRFDRASFYKALLTVRDDMTPAQVEHILGRPDDILSHGDPIGIRADMAWCYGTNKHLGFASLGTVLFRKGRTYFQVLQDRGNTPFKQLLPEADLRRIMWRFYDGPHHPRFYYPYDPGWVIQFANALIPLGVQKAAFVIQQICRVDGTAFDHGELLWVMRTMFEVPNPPGFMPVPSIGAIDPIPPDNLRSSPRYPLVLTRDVPFNVMRGCSLGGPPESAEEALTYYRKYKLPTRLLVPPNDPFLAYQSLLTNPEWPWSHGKIPRGNFAQADSGFELGQVLQMVRGVFQPVDFRLDPQIFSSQFEAFHNQFLALKVHWDARRQRYVRRDGITLKDRVNPPIRFWVPVDFNSMHVEVTLSRLAETSRVSMYWDTDDIPEKTSAPAVLKVVNASTGKLIGWYPIDTIERPEIPEAERTDLSAMERYLALPPYKTRTFSRGAGGQIDIPLGTKLQLEVICPGHSERSPAIRP